MLCNRSSLLLSKLTQGQSNNICTASIAYGRRSLATNTNITTTTTTPTSNTMTTYNISITSDIVCPWCYIGHSRLTRAIDKHLETNPQDEFNLSYKPFYLSPPAQLAKKSTPAFPVTSRPRMEVYESKFGAARTHQMSGMLKDAATKDGLAFKFGGKTGHSRNGHRLVYYAQSHGGEKAQNDVMLGLWRRYFEQEIDITELDVLVEVGVEAGLGSKDKIREYLVSGKDGDVVDRVAEQERLQGISGVPFYVLQDRWVVEGAQEPRAFETLFAKWKEVETKQGKAVEDALLNGTACTKDSC